jgi:hypothetical protein
MNLDEIFNRKSTEKLIPAYRRKIVKPEQLYLTDKFSHEFYLSDKFQLNSDLNENQHF